MKKHLIALMTLFMASCTTSPGSSSSFGLPLKGTVTNPDVSFFPKSQDGYIGDPMPYFDGETMNIFYLLQEDKRSAVGFHPWSLLQTNDLMRYEDIGVVIPYVKDVASPDLALGTGSIIKDKQGTYHAFYTGYNGTGNMDYYEKIQHATSPDLLTWTKHPEDGFYGGHNDFRDPYVLYMEAEATYWMLITTRDSGGGIIALYKSSDLNDWTYDSVFFRNDSGTYNMECVSLVQYNGYWYMSYSEQGAHRVTHYRYRQSLTSGSWIKPLQDYFDGAGTYAGRIEKAWDRLFFFGWQAVKQYDYDGGDFDWSGNLVTHELFPTGDGLLHPSPTAEAIEEVATRVHYPLMRHSNAVMVIDESLDQGFEITFNQTENIGYALFEALETKPTRMSFTINSPSALDQFGLTFTAKNNADQGSTNILFNRQRNALEFYNVNPEFFDTSLPQAYVPLDIVSGVSLDIDILLEGECLTLYVGGQMCLSVRMYQKSGFPFGFFSKRSAPVIKDLQFYE